MVLLHVKIQLVGIKNYVLAAFDIYGNLENRPPINEKKIELIQRNVIFVH